MGEQGTEDQNNEEHGNQIDLCRTSHCLSCLFLNLLKKGICKQLLKVKICLLRVKHRFLFLTMRRLVLFFFFFTIIMSATQAQVSNSAASKWGPNDTIL